MFCVHMVYYITRANLLSFLLVKINCIALFTTLITNHVPYIFITTVKHLKFIRRFTVLENLVRLAILIPIILFLEV